MVVLALVAYSNPLSAQDVRITEFMASNTGGLQDENREFSDWIEITNLGTNTVNLLNWALTDDRGRPFLWRFPQTNLNIGASMVVFASGKDRKVPGAPLHTSFGLAADGEYLALVRPNGTIATEFDYPQQAPDVSYGFGHLTTNVTVIASNAAVRVRVPANEADGTNWTTLAYDDSGWQLGTNGVGFGSTNITQADYGAAIQPTAPVGYWRFNESAGTSAANIGSGVGLDGTANSAAVLGAVGPRPPQLGGFEPGNFAAAFNGSSTFVEVNNSLLNGRNAFTIAGWIYPTVAPGARVGLFGQNDCVEFGFISTGTLQCWSFNPPTGGGAVNATFNPPLNAWSHVAAVGNGTDIRIYTNGVLAGTGGAATATYGSSSDKFNIGGGGIFDTMAVNGNWFNGRIDEVAAYHRALSAAEVRSLYSAGTNLVGFSVVPFVKTDIGGSMSNINASARIRLPFNLVNPTNVALLTLRMRFDDGFSAFINGLPLTRENAPDPLLFNSSATESHSAAGFTEYRLGAGLLMPGANVLAIQGLNQAVDDPDFLITAELIATTVSATSDQPLYFTAPTPGALNSGGVALVGPAILDPAHTPNVPKDHEDLLVTARVVQTLFPPTNVVLRYRVMFAAEIEQQMFDDGLHGDGAAGDKVYGATIPASASTNSQMIRWFIRARDDHGNVSRWPLFTDPFNGAEYLGTMVDYTVVSKLPVIHFFAPESILDGTPPTTGGTADSQGGGRVALFYDGEFYDNVHMQVRGNTTAGYLKKSHRVEFNNEHLFRHSPEYPRISKTSFVADYPDPAYMRQGLCFWLGNEIGSPGSFYYPVRLQLNGVFYQLANHNDVQDQDLLERLGLDPNGALYNAAGQVRDPVQSTGVFEKKTRRWDNNNDYNTLARGIAETNSLATRRLNAYDFFDIPNVINYLVIGRWSHENDDVWANMSLYHDNDGDDQWRIISFDMNLSWGAIFAEGDVSLYTGVQSTNDNHKAHPLYGSSTTPSAASGNWNRVYDTFFAIPELREMFLRRMRSMMDTYVKPPGLHPLLYPMEERVRALRELMFDEAERDRNYWGWPPLQGQCNFPPGIRFQQGVDGVLNEFIARRRTHFYVKHSISNATAAFPVGIYKTNNAGIPLEQPANASVLVGAVEYNPGSGNQLHEYLTITNPHPYAVDISDWTLSGGVEFTFHKGTVIPANRVAYLVPDVRAFKARPVAPRGGMGLFVIGPYQGQLSARGEPLIISNTMGEMVYSNAYVGTPSLLQQYLRVTEIMYNPARIPGEPTDPDEFEFIELRNISTTVTLSLAGVRFTEGITFDFTGSAVTTLAPGARVLVVKNAALFGALYGFGLNVAGEYLGNLDDSGDRIKLVDATNEEIHDFDYEDDWYPITDGGGYSLAIINQNADPGMWDSKLNWRPSGDEGGAPDAPESAPPDVAIVLINEVLTHTDLPTVDTIELYNPSNAPVNIGGWFLTDDFSLAKKYRIPNGTIIPAGGYLTFDESQFNPGGNGFALGSDGDEAYLFSGDDDTNLTGYAHGYSFGAAANGVSFGRHTNSVGDIHFVAQSVNTLPGVNATPRVGPVIISEFMYRPPDASGGVDNSQDEYIELQNVSGSDVPLYDPANPANTWQLRGGVEFDFPQGVTIPAGGFVLVANFKVSDPALLTAFRQKFNVPAQVPVFGPYQGQLNNNSDEIELKRPDAPLPNNNVPYVMVEQVDYRDEAPWPVAADGTAASLHRLGPALYANDPAHWTAAAASAGQAYVAGAVPVITSQPANQNAVALDNATLSVGASGSGLRYQWRFKGANIEGGTNSTLTLQNLQLHQAGEYNVTVYNSAGAVLSSNAVLNVRLGALILSQPVSVNKRPGEANTFSVSAYTQSTLTYQWRFNGNPIPGANGPSYTVSNIQLSHGGAYDVVLTDDVGTIVSAPATLLILINPLIVVHPIAQTVPAGSSVILSAQVTNTATLPIGFRWRRNGGAFLSNNVNGYVNFITMTNVQGTSLMDVIAHNIALPGGNISARVNVIGIPDNDRDGLPDNWEVVYNLDTNNAADASLDLDLDTMSNLAEYIAGTDPSDPNSFLKINIPEGGGPALLSFQAVSNRSYTVEFSDEAPGGPWSKLADSVARTNNRLETVIDPGATSKRYYRLITPRQAP